MTAATDRILQGVLASCPGSSPNVQRLELLNTCIEFCRQSLAWQEFVDFLLIAGEEHYNLAPAETELVHLFSIEHKTLDLAKAAINVGTLELAVAPTSTDITHPLFVHAAYAPTGDITNAVVDAMMPDDIWVTHEDTLRSGTIARLMMQPAKPYSNAGLGQMHRRHFRAGVAEARKAAMVAANNRAKQSPRYEARNVSMVGAQVWRFPRWA